MIFLIGAARSGTTLLGEYSLGKHSSINYVGEKNWIWKYGNAYKNHEQLSERDITEKKYKYIITRLEKLEKRNQILLEKTPSNCLRIKYINHIFPDSKFIHLIRDGYSASNSTLREWTNKGQNALDSAELRKSSIFNRLLKTTFRESELKYRKYDLIELLELPVYLKRLYNYLLRNLLSKPAIWGPRIPYLKKIRKENTLKRTCAYQWAYCVEKAYTDLKKIDNERVLTIHYENLIQSPQKILKSIFDFLEIKILDDELLFLSNNVAQRKLATNIDAEIQDIIDPVHNLIFKNETNHTRP